MRSIARRELVAGPAGAIECALDAPFGFPAEDGSTVPRGIALVSHPHPLYGGALDNKVTQTLARTFVDLGYLALRPNFRGVGASAGAHDNGNGETDDLLCVLEHLHGLYGALPTVLAGFSFGAFVQTRVAERLAAKGAAAERMVLVGVAVKRYAARPVAADTLVIHGEVDATVPLADVLDWARPQELPVVVVPGADHFFHRRLHVLRAIVSSNWRGA